MKHFLLAGLVAGVAMGAAAATSPIYIHTGVLTTTPMIDATSFVNKGNFTVSTFGASLFGAPFDFSNTRNFTNENLMNGSPGFRFDTAPSGAGQRYMAANFYNAGFGASAANASITASSQLFISATNIVSRGTLNVGVDGLMTIQGRNVDLARGITTASSGALVNPPQRITDAYWGGGPNRIDPVVHLLSASPLTPTHQVISLFTSGGLAVYFTNKFNFLSLSGTNPTLTAVELVSEGPTNRTVQVVFVRNNAFNGNTNVNVQIQIVGGTPTEMGTPVIQWSAAGTDAAGLPVTNFLYMTDTFGSNPTNSFITNSPLAPPGGFFQVPPFSYQPENFSLSLSSFEQTVLGNPAVVPYTDRPPDFWGVRPLGTNVYSAWSANIGAASFDVLDPALARLSPGRVEITADRSLDLTRANILVPNYLRIQATNHFKGASNAIISAPFSDVALGSTNGQLHVRNLLTPIIPRISGTVSAYSATWTNDVAFGGATNSVIFNVLYVDSSLTTEILAQQLDVSLRSTNVIISDTLNVINSLTLDAERLTVKDTGVINLQGFTQNWVDNAPRLRELTNMGSIYNGIEFYFHGRNTAGAVVPYRQFVNSGFIYAAGNTIISDNIQNSGQIYSLYGPVFMRSASNVVLQAGGFLASTDSEVVIEANNLTVTNHFILPGRSLSLSVTNALKAGPNNWSVNAGFNLWRKPVTGDLSETEIVDLGFPNTEVLHTWAGVDRGPAAAGFTNNAALGVLNLDGGEGTVFTFAGTGPSTNALYVDVLNLLNSAAEQDADGNLPALNVLPGMKIYFSQAFSNGVDVTSTLAGKNGGTLGQVPHVGPLSVAARFALKASDIDLKVSVLLTPQPHTVVSWNTVAGATSHLYCVEPPKGTNWTVVTNFVSPVGGRVSITEPVSGGGGRFFKVRVDQP